MFTWLFFRKKAAFRHVVFVAVHLIVRIDKLDYFRKFMAKLMKNKIMKYNDPYFGDFSLDVLRLSRHATERAQERKIPVTELVRSRSHINGYINKIVGTNGLVITAYPRSTIQRPLPENGRRFTFPKDGIPHFIGKFHANIKRIQAEYHLKFLYFDKNNALIAVAPTSDYDWIPVEKVIETASKRKYKPPAPVVCGEERK